MMKLISISFFAGVAAAVISSAQAMPINGTGIAPRTTNITRVWDNCGHGQYRTPSGRCVSNWHPGPNGCPPGFHLGWDVRTCIQNR